MKKILALVLALVVCLGAATAMAETLGLGVHTGIGSSKDASVVDGENYDGTAQVDSTICTVVLADDGTIVSIAFDVAQTRVTFSPEGAITADKAAEIKTKKEKGDEYGMRGVSEIGAEVFEQIASLEEYCVGKTPEEVLSMPTYQRDENHPNVPDDADLKSTVTITVGDFLAALEKAAANAK